VMYRRRRETQHLPHNPHAPKGLRAARGVFQHTRSEQGVSLVEVLVVVAIVGIIANIAVPALMDAMVSADAGRVLADVDMIHDAVLAYRMEQGSYPRSAGWGRVPNGLAPYLPDGFSFTYKDLRYRYQLQARAKRLGIDGGGKQSAGRAIVQKVGEMYQGRKTVAKRRVWLWLPSPGGKLEG